MKNHFNKIKGNIKIEICNNPGTRKFLSWISNGNVKLNLNKLWKTLSDETDGLLEMIYSSERGMYILVYCNDTTWTVYKGLVIMKKNDKTEFKYDGDKKFKCEIFNTIPSELKKHLKSNTDSYEV
jgi:hypothetical protein